MPMNDQRYRTGNAGGGAGFNALSAGAKHYGSGRNNPTMGPVDRTGYINRDAALKARRNAILRRLQSQQTGQYLQPGSIR